jgi:hypothetical protein
MLGNKKFKNEQIMLFFLAKYVLTTKESLPAENNENS